MNIPFTILRPIAYDNIVVLHSHGRSGPRGFFAYAWLVHALLDGLQ